MDKNREFQETRPWIDFVVDLQSQSTEFWMALGEIRSKCEHMAGVALRPEAAECLYQIYLAKGVAATTAIEGNTLGEEEVLKHVQGELDLPPTEEYLQTEIENIVRACNGIAEQFVGIGPNPALTPKIICDYNREVRAGLKEPSGISAPGILRTESVVVGGVYRGAPAKDCPFLMDRLCAWLGELVREEEEWEVPMAIIRAVVAHLYLAWIHPFGDGNGRTARLLEFHLLVAGGLPLPVAHLLSDHYNRTRSEYYRLLDEASKKRNPGPFIEYAIAGLAEGLRRQLGEVRTQQWDISWENYVHREFARGKQTITTKRQRDLVLDLSHTDIEWWEIDRLPDLSPRVARAYNEKTVKTVQRDVKLLGEQGFLVRRGKSVRAAKEKILAFLPRRAMEDS